MGYRPWLQSVGQKPGKTLIDNDLWKQKKRVPAVYLGKDQ